VLLTFAVVDDEEVTSSARADFTGTSGTVEGKGRLSLLSVTTGCGSIACFFFLFTIRLTVFLTTTALRLIPSGVEIGSTVTHPKISECTQKKRNKSMYVYTHTHLHRERERERERERKRDSPPNSSVYS
jgi:hypothetical protein